MRAFVVVVVLLGLVTGCGGGGGDGHSGGDFSATPVALNASASGSLTASSIRAPDGTYVNLYSLTLTNPAQVNLRLESVDFDCYLFLLTNSALSERNMDAWDAYLLAENDDMHPTDTNSGLTVQLGAGTYVIAVNSFDPATGNYFLLTTDLTAPPLAGSDLVNGSLAAGDARAPGDLRYDLYAVTATAATPLNLRLESVDFDAYVALFDAAALNDPDLMNWGSYLLADNDNVVPQAGDAGLTWQLNPGSYLVAVSSATPGLGSYVLKADSMAVTFIRQYLQYRTYENTANNRFMAWVDYKDGNALLLPGDLLSAAIFDSFGAEISPTSQEFITGGYVTAAWDPGTASFTSIVLDGDSGFSFNLANQTDLPGGPYSFQVVPAVGGLLTSNLTYPGRVDLPVVVSSGMNAQWNPDGSLTLSWNEPPGTFDQYRVVLSNSNGRVIFFGRCFPGISQVTLQADLVTQISLEANLPAGATVNWTMQTRNYVGSENYARGISEPVPIVLP